MLCNFNYYVSCTYFGTGICPFVYKYADINKQIYETHIIYVNKYDQKINNTFDH